MQPQEIFLPEGGHGAVANIGYGLPVPAPEAVFLMGSDGFCGNREANPLFWYVLTDKPSHRKSQ